MQRAIERLSIKVPRTFSGGTYISDFDLPPSEAPAPPDEGSPSPVKRLYANKRGRKAAQRDDVDLVKAFQAGALSEDWLRERGLLEVWPC